MNANTLALALTAACARTHSTVPEEISASVPDVARWEASIGRADTIVERHVLIPASPTCVYDVLTDIDAWSAWDPSIEAAYHVDGEAFEPGTVFYQGFVHDAFEAHSRVLVAERGEQVVWRGQSPDGTGPIGLHSYRLRDQGDGTTLVVNREAFSAWYVRPIAWFTDLGIGAQFEDVLQALSARSVERCGSAGVRDDR